MKKDSSRNISDVAPELDETKTTLEDLRREQEELAKIIQARYRLAVRKARRARNIENKTGKLWHVIRALFWEWQERHFRKKLIRLKRISSKKPKKHENDDSDLFPPPRIRETHTFPKGTVS